MEKMDNLKSQSRIVKMAGIVLTGSILVGSGIGIGYLFNRNHQAKGAASSGQVVEALKTASPISQNTNNKIDITSLVESDGARGLKILVPTGWSFETSDGGGSGASSSWKDPSNPERNVFVARGMQIGAWYGLDGVDGSIDPKGLLPAGAKIVRLNQFTFGYQVNMKNSDLVTDGVWQAEISSGGEALGYKEASVTLTPSEHAVASKVLNSFIKKESSISNKENTNLSQENKNNLSSNRKFNSVCSRQEFMRLVMGKSTKQVLAIIGTPSKTDLLTSEFWEYREKTKDEVTQKVDYSAVIEFRDGIAMRVMFD